MIIKFVAYTNSLTFKKLWVHFSLLLFLCLPLLGFDNCCWWIYFTDKWNVLMQCFSISVRGKSLWWICGSWVASRKPSSCVIAALRRTTSQLLQRLVTTSGFMNSVISIWLVSFSLLTAVALRSQFKTLLPSKEFVPCPQFPQCADILISFILPVSWSRTLFAN